MNDIKSFVGGVLCSLMALLDPIKDFEIAMVFVFTLNYLCGCTADAVNGTKWSMKKTLWFGLECFVFLGIIVFLFLIGHFLHKREEALFCAQWACIIASWAYAKNILRNLKQIFKKGGTMYMIVDVLYFIVSFELIEKIPYVKRYIEAKQAEINKKREKNE